MTMEIECRLYPHTPEEVTLAAQALEHFRGVLEGMGVNVQYNIPVTVGMEPNPHWKIQERTVVKIAGHIHFDDGETFHFGFGAALTALKSGKKVARAGWNGKGMWLALVKPGDDRHPPQGFVATYYMSVVHEVTGALQWIGMKTADNKFVPWLASQTDMLAEDWVIVN